MVWNEDYMDLNTSARDLRGIRLFGVLDSEFRPLFGCFCVDELLVGSVRLKVIHVTNAAGVSRIEISREAVTKVHIHLLFTDYGLHAVRQHLDSSG